MRVLLMVLSVLTLATPPSQSATPTPAPAVEAGLLSVLGLPRRPQVDRRRAVIPPAMLELYRQQTGQDLDTSTLPLPGRLTRSANTVRSFTHTGNSLLRLQYFEVI